MSKMIIMCFLLLGCNNKPNIDNEQIVENFKNRYGGNVITLCIDELVVQKFAFIDDFNILHYGENLLRDPLLDVINCKK